VFVPAYGLVYDGLRLLHDESGGFVYFGLVGAVFQSFFGCDVESQLVVPVLFPVHEAVVALVGVVAEDLAVLVVGEVEVGFELAHLGLLEFGLLLPHVLLLELQSALAQGLQAVADPQTRIGFHGALPLVLLFLTLVLLVFDRLIDFGFYLVLDFALIIQAVVDVLTVRL